jgi:hypothetical protein
MYIKEEKSGRKLIDIAIFHFTIQSHYDGAFPKPRTYDIRWTKSDKTTARYVCVAMEAEGLVQSYDGSKLG